VIEVEGSDLPGMHHRFAAALATAYGMIVEIQRSARAEGKIRHRPRWPMIILRSPKGWTGPDKVDGTQVAGTWRAHQVPLSGVRENQDHLRLLEEWMRSYRPEELFDADGAPVELVREANPLRPLRMGASPHANGGLVSRPLDLPDFAEFGVSVDSPGSERAESTRQLGSMLAEIYRRNPERFRLFCPDETNSNRLGAVFEVSDRAFMERVRRAASSRSGAQLASAASERGVFGDGRSEVVSAATGHPEYGAQRGPAHRTKSVPNPRL
jgi:xylulose-5-phosphate/fructose-6-phosphate phosphoketolase